MLRGGTFFGFGPPRTLKTAITFVISIKTPNFSIALRIVSSDSVPLKDGAGDGDRTRDVQLGKLAFYH